MFSLVPPTKNTKNAPLASLEVFMGDSCEMSYRISWHLIQSFLRRHPWKERQVRLPVTCSWNGKRKWFCKLVAGGNTFCLIICVYWFHWNDSQIVSIAVQKLQHLNVAVLSSIFPLQMDELDKYICCWLLKTTYACDVLLLFHLFAIVFSWRKVYTFSHKSHVAHYRSTGWY